MFGRKSLALGDSQGRDLPQHAKAQARMDTVLVLRPNILSMSNEPAIGDIAVVISIRMHTCILLKRQFAQLDLSSMLVFSLKNIRPRSACDALTFSKIACHRAFLAAERHRSSAPIADMQSS